MDKEFETIILEKLEHLFQELSLINQHIRSLSSNLNNEEKNKTITKPAIKLNTEFKKNINLNKED